MVFGFSRKKKAPANGGNVNSIGANSISGGATVFRVTVPENVQPGEEFQVYAGTRIVRVRCPMDSRPGQNLQITVPAEQSPPSGGIGDSQRETRSPRQQRTNSFPHDSRNVRRIENSDPPAYMVEIPAGTQAGQQFPVTIQGQQLMVTCPPNAGPGQSVRIVPPPTPTNLNRPPTDDSLPKQKLKPEESEEKTQLYEVEVPKGVQPGAPFALMAGGVRVLVTCPPNAGPGQRIRFKLPLALTQKRSQEGDSLLTKIKLKYGDKEGWSRTVRATDLKFQWIRMDEKGDIDLNKRFNFEKSAYVRKLEFRAGEDPRIRTGILSLVPATESVVDSRIKSASGQDLVTYSQLAEAQRLPFNEKVEWFQQTCAKLCVEWNEGHMRMNVRREHLLGDSVDAVMSLSRKDLRKVWRFEFIGEMGIDAGGLAREWFQLVCKEIFDPDMGLWMCSASNQMSMDINPASGTCHNG
jgi:hypothetical protein